MAVNVWCSHRGRHDYTDYIRWGVITVALSMPLSGGSWLWYYHHLHRSSLLLLKMIIMHIEVYGCCLSRLNIQTVDICWWENTDRQRERETAQLALTAMVVGWWINQNLKPKKEKKWETKSKNALIKIQTQIGVINAIMEGGKHTMVTTAHKHIIQFF